jgi:hypothetical protein
MRKYIFFRLLGLVMVVPASLYSQKTAVQGEYPKIVEYTSFFLPVVSTNSKTTTWNFSNSFTIGFATGINVLYSDTYGFSFDVSPVITAANGNSKVTNFIFDPGPIFRFKKGFSLITRIAFETAGRYGESTVFSKVFYSGQTTSFFTAVGIPIRFGNNLPPSIGATLFFGLAFK